jgi:hypothetical protein
MRINTPPRPRKRIDRYKDILLKEEKAGRLPKGTTKLYGDRPRKDNYRNNYNIK